MAISALSDSPPRGGRETVLPVLSLQPRDGGLHQTGSRLGRQSQVSSAATRRRPIAFRSEIGRRTPRAPPDFGELEKDLEKEEASLEAREAFWTMNG